jgi:hypothetical protein
MRKAGFIYCFFFMGLLFPITGCAKKSDPNESIYNEVICFGGDAIASADLTVKGSGENETVRLVLDPMAGESKSFRATLKSGAFRQMVDQGRIEILMPSEKHPLTSHGGETMYAALVDLSADKKGNLKGYLALEGSVFEVWCPKDPLAFIEKK